MQQKPGIMFMIHCTQDVGYAIERLVCVFKSAAECAGYDSSQIYFSYTNVVEKENSSLLQCDYHDVSNNLVIIDFIRRNNIDKVVAFDLNYPAAIIPVLRLAGVKNIISYWGARISSINTGFKLLLKKLEWFLRRNKPDFFIFESTAMQRTATHGRGVPEDRTCVVPLGVDTDKFFPQKSTQYIYDQFDIDTNRAVIFYSGHMEERKGVRVIINAAIELLDSRSFDKVHFVICGNKQGEEQPYTEMLSGCRAEGHVTFEGYRDDIEDLMAGASIGVIASTGWDSFTMSSVEMMASGLPLIVSDLEGLSETIVHDKNGYLFTPGDAIGLADYIQVLLDDSDLLHKFSEESRARAVSYFSRELQVERIARLIEKV